MQTKKRILLQFNLEGTLIGPPAYTVNLPHATKYITLVMQKRKLCKVQSREKTPVLLKQSWIYNCQIDAVSYYSVAWNVTNPNMHHQLSKHYIYQLEEVQNDYLESNFSAASIV